MVTKAGMRERTDERKKENNRTTTTTWRIRKNGFFEKCNQTFTSGNKRFWKPKWLQIWLNWIFDAVTADWRNRSLVVWCWSEKTLVEWHGTKYIFYFNLIFHLFSKRSFLLPQRGRIMWRSFWFFSQNSFKPLNVRLTTTTTDTTESIVGWVKQS